MMIAGADVIVGLLPWLLDLYPGEQVFPLDRLQQGGMVGGHVRSDC